MVIKISHLEDVIDVDDNVQLRAKSSESFDNFAKVAKENRDFLFKWLPWAENTPDDSSVEHYKTAPEKKQNNEEANWDIYVNNELAGAIGAMLRDKERDVIEIGYWLAEKYNGQGIMTACTKKLCDVLFRETTTPLIEIGADIRNEKSKAIPQRLGFKLDREFSEHPKLPHIDHGVYYSLTRQQWSYLFS
ncbi:MAG: GNAT family protein [Acidimicrobiia bacterium]